MKKIGFYLILAAALSAAACSGVETDVPSGNIPANAFLAEITATKVDLQADKSLAWAAGDAVAVHDGSSTLEYTAASAGATTTLEGAVDVDAAKTYYAFYPASGAKSFSGAVVTAEIPYTQTPVKDNFPFNPMVSATDGASKSFFFRNVCGLIGFEIGRSDISNVVISANGGEPLTGTVTVDCSSASPAASVVEGKNSVILQASKAFASGTYWVAVLPGSFASGITCTMFNSEGKQVQKSTSNAFTLGRSHRVELSTIDGASPASVFSISNPAELQAYLMAAAKSESSSATLTADLDLSGYTITPADTLKGTFDGAGHVISNWTTTRPLFKVVHTTGTLKDIELASSCHLLLNEESYANASGTYTQGYIVGKNNGTMSGCINRASLESTSTEPAKGVTRFIGLVAGENNGTMTGCKNYGDLVLSVNATAQYAHHVAGGLIGKLDMTETTPASVVSCENHGKVQITIGTSQSIRVYAGGILGRSQIKAPGSEADRGTLSDCSNSGEVGVTVPNGIVASVVSAGGIAGYLEGSMTGCRNSGKVSYLANQDNSENELQPRPLVGGIAGGIMYGASNCVNDADVEVYGAFVGGPALSNSVGGANNLPCVGGVFGSVGNGTADAGSALSACGNTGKVDVTALMKPSNTTMTYTGGVAGYLCVPASGCYNAGSVSMKSHMQTSYLGGVAGFTLCALDDCDNSASIDLDLDLTATSSNQSKYLNVGGIVAATSGTFAISDCDNTGASITVRKGFNNESKNYVGGIAGDTGVAAGNAVGFTNCTNSASIIATGGNPRLRVGGIVGQTSGLLDGCSNTGDIDLATNRDYTMIGGLAGYMKFTDNTPGTNDVIVGCTQNGSIAYKATGAQGNAYLGGLVARYDSATSGAGNDRKPRVVNTGITAAISVNGGGSATAGYAFGWLNYVSQVNLGVNSAGSYLTVYSGTSVLGEAVTSSNYNTKPSPALGKTSLSDMSKIYNGGSRYSE